MKHQRYFAADRLTVKRCVYYLANARAQGVDLRIRCVTHASREAAAYYADSLAADFNPSALIQFRSWDEDPCAFRGGDLDCIVCSGFGDRDRMDECYARLRGPSEAVDRWGKSLEIIAP